MQNISTHKEITYGLTVPIHFRLSARCEHALYEDKDLKYKSVKFVDVKFESINYAIMNIMITYLHLANA